MKEEKIKCEGKNCDNFLTEKAVAYVRANERKFGGLMLCYTCQNKHQIASQKARKNAKSYGNLVSEGHKIIKSLPQIRNLVENDILEIFGDTGTGKSRLVAHFAREIIENDESVLYIDTERNLSKKDRNMLGDNYYYTPQILGLQKAVSELDRNLDFVIIDSLGMPVLTQFAKFSMKERGEALLMLTAILGDLKDWTYESGGTCLLTNQPVSEMSGQKDRRPFGDKSQFVVKEILKMDLRERGTTTKSNLRTFRSRILPYNQVIARIEISNDGMNITWENLEILYD